LTSIIENIWDLVKKADEVLEGVIHRTPLSHSYSFSRMSSGEVYLKQENMQKTGSFKVRGAYFKLYRNLEKARSRGVITASSGNHAQAVAYSSMKMGIPATIVMPITTPVYKVNATKSYGAKVILHGDVYDDAYKKAMEIQENEKLLFIHPFNDPEVIAGQGTIGIEIARELRDIDYVVVPIGGGGLISGIGTAIKKMLGNSVKVVGVEPKNAPKYYESRKANKILSIKPKPSLADGVVTKSVGELTFEIMSEVVDDVVLVDEDAIARAMVLLMERAKIVVEGAGALPLAAIIGGYLDVTNKKVITVLSGGNVDLTTIYRIIMRGLTVEDRIFRVRVLLRDVPGALNEILTIFASNRCNIVDIKHDRMDPYVIPGYASVEITFEAPDRESYNKVINEIKSRGITLL